MLVAAAPRVGAAAGGRGARRGVGAGYRAGSGPGKGVGPPPPPSPAPDRISTTASAWRRCRGSPRGAGGGGAGGAAYRKVSCKGAEDPAAGAQAPAPPPAQGMHCPANVGTWPPSFCAAHAQPSLSPTFPLAACQGGGLLTRFSMREQPSPHPILVPEGPKGDLRRRL